MADWPVPPLPRLTEAALERALRLFPVVVVTGARRTGKSTLVRSAPATAGHRYHTLDNAEIRGIAAAEPRELLYGEKGVTLDEVQRVPELLLAVKEAVDEAPHMGRIVLTGSANLLLLKRASESLAGRARYLTLWPMTRREQLGLGTAGMWSEFFTHPRAEWVTATAAQIAPREDWRLLATRGGYPEPALRFPEPSQDSDRRELFEAYTQTYLERDLRDLAAIDALADFRRLMRVVALRVGNVVHQTDIARDVSLPRTTVQRYLDLLEVSYQLVRVEPYAVNRTKRVVKAPKLYWSDTGLALALAGTSEPTGAHLENIVLTDLLAWRETQPGRPSILYWRTDGGAEVDFVIEWNGRLLPIEVKATTRPGYDDARHLRTFAAEYGNDVLGGLLLHDGEETSWVSEGILAVPWWKVI